MKVKRGARSGMNAWVHTSAHRTGSDKRTGRRRGRAWPRHDSGKVAIATIEHLFYHPD